MNFQVVGRARRKKLNFFKYHSKKKIKKSCNRNTNSPQGLREFLVFTLYISVFLLLFGIIFKTQTQRAKSQKTKTTKAKCTRGIWCLRLRASFTLGLRRHRETLAADLVWGGLFRPDAVGMVHITVPRVLVYPWTPQGSFSTELTKHLLMFDFMG